MKIVAPIANVEEIEILARAGAGEFYCGFVPDEWIGNFRAPDSNRCPAGNFRSHAELDRGVRTAHRHGCSISLVLDAQGHTDEQLAAVAGIADSFLDMGGDALIISGLGLIGELFPRMSLGRIHVSSAAACGNGNTAWFCRELGASRLILPRDVTMGEACEIAAGVPDLEIETFIMNDGCAFGEGACATPRLPRYRRWPWYRFSCGFPANEAGMPFGPCGLCALPHLQKGGVAAVKIAGRAAPTARKLAGVRMVRAILDRVEAGDGNEEAMRFAQASRPSEEHCRTGYMCCYPEVPGH